jgi:hypothetical protein
LDRRAEGLRQPRRAALANHISELVYQQAAEKSSDHVILSGAKCRSLLEDLAVIGTKDLLFVCFNERQPAAAGLSPRRPLSMTDTLFQQPASLV